jgi:hypothetical protein
MAGFGGLFIRMNGFLAIRPVLRTILWNVWFEGLLCIVVLRNRRLVPDISIDDVFDKIYCSKTKSKEQ